MATVDPALVAQLGPRYAFGAVADELADEELQGPFMQAKVVLAEERLSTRARCKMSLQRGAVDREQHRVPLTVVTCR